MPISTNLKLVRYHDRKANSKRILQKSDVPKNNQDVYLKILVNLDFFKLCFVFFLTGFFGIFMGPHVLLYRSKLNDFIQRCFSDDDERLYWKFFYDSRILELCLA